MDQQAIKEEILTRIRTGKPPAHPLPDVPQYAYNENPVEDFIKHLIAFDGRAVKFRTRDDALAWLRNLDEMNPDNNQIYSSTEGIIGNVTEADIADLRNARKIRVCVTEGEMGVGEMGSIWVTDTSLKHAACALLARRLFIFLDSDRIVGSLHAAYAGIKLREHQYGSFFSGPSATADIEAVHITGAQGPLALTALIYNCKDAPDTPELIVNPAADKSVWMKSSLEDDG